MKQPIVHKKTNILSLLLGHSLAAILCYIIYRAGAFIIAEIDIPVTVANLGFTLSAITITLAGTGIVLHHAKPTPHALPLSRTEHYIP